MKSCLGLLAMLALTSVHAHSLNDDLFAAPKEIVATYHYRNYHMDMLDMMSKEVEVLGVNLKTNQIDLFLTKDQFQNLKSLGYELSLSEAKNAPMGLDTEYKTSVEIAAFLQTMHKRYPDLTKLVSIGKSLEGRDIWAIKISDNPMADEKEPAILFNSMHHAREVMTPEIAIDIVEQLLENYHSNERIAQWVDNTEIWVVPMLNVDGNNKVWTGQNMWRKNTSNITGVDINRNYPYKWGACGGSSGSRMAQDYRGPKAGSELETQALMRLVADIRPVFDISFHSYSELVIYPFGCDGERTATFEVVEAIGKEMASLMKYTPGTSWETLYSVDGGDIDWMYDAYQVLPYVIEVSSSEQGFQPRYGQWRDKTVQLVRKSWTLLLDRLAGSSIRGEVLNSDGASIKDFTVEVRHADGRLFQNYRGNPDGTFHIVVNPGEYKLTLKTAGREYQSESVKVGSSRVDTRFQL